MCTIRPAHMLRALAAHLGAGAGQGPPPTTAAGGGVGVQHIVTTQSAADSPHITERPFVRADPVLTPEHLEFWEENGEPASVPLVCANRM